MFTFETLLTRWLPGAVFLACVVVLIVSPDLVGLEGAAILFGGGGAIVVVNYIQKHGFTDVERGREYEARAFLDRYGKWPGQASRDLIEQAERDGVLTPGTVRPRD